MIRKIFWIVFLFAVFTNTAQAVTIQKTIKIYNKMIHKYHLKPAKGLVIVMEDDINGWADSNDILGLTSGAVTKLSEDELAGTIGHELAHIQYGDAKKPWDGTKKVEDRADRYGHKWAVGLGYSSCKIAYKFIRYYKENGNQGGPGDSHSSNIKRFWRIYKHCRSR